MVKENKKNKKVPQLAEYILTDYSSYNSSNYLNLSFNHAKNVESATVAQLAEYLPHEQESSQTSGSSF